jgi:hypothetical protein
VGIRTGGAPNVKVLLKGGDEVRRAFVHPSDIAAVAPGLVSGVRELSKGTTELVLRSEASGTFSDILAELRRATLPQQGGDGGHRSLLAEWHPDVVVLSLAADVRGEVEVDEFLGIGLELVRLIKAAVGAHVLVFNCSSIDPDGFTSNYRRGAPDVTWRVHQFNRAAIELSMAEGVSIVDVDQLVALSGADSTVVSPLHYSDGLEEELGAEVARILADYGFFEQRPLVAQIGRQPLPKATFTT